MNKKVPAILLVATLLCIAVYIGVFIGRLSAGNITSLPDAANYIAENTEQKVTSMDLNAATQEDLMQLPGMTWQLAESIVQYREVYGDYVFIRELKSIHGMTEETYEQIKDYLFISP